MHDSYIVSSCIQLDNIESITGCGSKIIIGTKTGKLFMYNSPSGDSVNKAELYVYSYYETADKKPICQMKTVPEEKLLFVLTNGVINVFYIGGLHFKWIQSCLETKGCNIFAADVKVTRNQSGETDTLISLCVSVKRMLKFFIWKSEELQPLARVLSLKDEPKALGFMNNTICIGFKDEYIAYNIFPEIPERHELIVTSSLNRRNPCISLIKNSTFGMTKDDFLIFIDPTTFTKHNELFVKNKMEPIKWGASVLDFVWDEPYVIGRTDNGIEIRVLEDFGPTRNTLIQRIPSLKSINFLVRLDKGKIFAASQNEVWYLRMVDIPFQRKILLEQKKYKLAIELTNISDESEESKTEIIRKIRVSYARDLFVTKNFAAAFEELLAAEGDPIDVILLFPTSIKGELTTVESSSHPNIPELKDKELEDAILALIDYLNAARQKENYSKSILSVMDTTLLKCYLQTNDAHIAPILFRKQCNFLESERALKKHNKLNELIILYQVFEEHAKALELLKTQASIEGSSLFGNEKIVKYLQDLDKDYKDLIFEYSKWVLEKHPQDGLKIFTKTFSDQENNTIPRKEVLDFLSKSCESLVLPYLEHIVNDLNDPSPIVHEELIKNYVKTIKQIIEKSDILCRNKVPRIEREEVELYRSKLFTILEKSDKYCPERILQTFPSADFFKERIQVLEKINDHETILLIYIQILGNVEKAFAYCEKLIQNDDIFEILLEILLNPLEISPYKGVPLHDDFLKPNFDIIIQLLNKYPTKINLPRIFSLLPGDIPVHRIKNFMLVASRMNMKKKWDYAILKEMLKAELIRLNQEIQLHRKNNCLGLTDSSICKDCEKHFSNEQVLVRNANGDVLHLVCFKKQNKIVYI